MWKNPWFGGFIAFTLLGGSSRLLHGGWIAAVVGGVYTALVMWAEPWLKQNLRRRWLRLFAAALLPTGGWAVGMIWVHEISHRPWRGVDVAVGIMVFLLVGMLLRAKYEDPLDPKKRPSPP